jgi:hypothetical protein
MIAPLPWQNADRTRIGRLRVHGGTQSPYLRLAMSGMLERADLCPPGIPPAAVLIVRRMADPLPGRLSPQPRPGTSNAAWERAARDNLAGLHRRAARPGRGPVPPDADAVVFADESELLASLALDLVGGRLRERWWWRSVAGSSTAAFPPALPTLLRDRAVWVPATLARLARQGRAVEIVRALSPAEALSVLAAVSQAHGVSEAIAQVVSPYLQPVPYSAADAPSPPTGAAASRYPEPAHPLAQAPPLTPSQRPVGALPPWSPAVPPGAVPATLDRPRACLLGIALMLHHRPEAVRSAAFAMRLQRWWQRQPTAPARTAPPVQPEPDAAPHAGRIAAMQTEHTSQPVTNSVRAEIRPPPRTPEPPLHPRDAAPPLATKAKGVLATDAPPAPPPRVHEQSAQDLPSSRPATASDADDRPPPQPAAPAPATKAPTSQQEPASHDRLAADQHVAVSHQQPNQPDAGEPPLAADAPSPEPGLSLESGVETALGGILYLINAMSALDLPDCFESEWRLASTAGAWTVLDALGRALLPSVGSHGGDPIWTALAALSGRDPRAPLGAGLPRRARYQLPTAWIDHLADDTGELRVWAAHGRRLRVWSRAGYMLSETHHGSPHDKRTLSTTLLREHFGNAPLATLSGPLVETIDPALRRWLALAIPFIRRRLIRALGIDSTGENLHEALLGRRGHLHVTPTHVDMVMRLDSVLLPVRQSGLDRNPGWLPAFSRVILFHFE